MGRLDDLITSVLPTVKALRQDLHAHPELMFEEHRTASRVVEHLRQCGNLEIRENFADTPAVVAILNAQKSPPAVLLRADMDALPIQEQTDLPYASKEPGRMHACGHDGHTACLVGAAMVLSRMADEIPGPVVFVFQPAEEGGAGGKAVVEAGVLNDPPVEVAFALHAWPKLKVGQVGLCKGCCLAAADTFRITVKAAGAHAASPHATADPIAIAARIIDNLQHIRSRMIDPIEPMVLTVAQIHGGSATNVIPDRVEMAGTIRTLSESVREKVHTLLAQVCNRTAEAFDAEVEVNIHAGYPVMHNDEKVVGFAEQVIRRRLGSGAVVHLGPSMGAEDFAYYLQKVPGAMLRLGIEPSKGPSYPLHHPKFDFNDEALPVGVRLLADLTLAWFKNRSARGRKNKTARR